MANLNRIILIGRLNGDPEARFTVNGTPITKFTLAIDRFQKEGLPKSADLIDVVTWSKLAEVSAQYLKKGRLVLVEGSIQIRSFNDETGQRKWVTEVVARGMQMLDKAAAAPAAAVPDQLISQAEPMNDEDVPEMVDDLPF